MMRLACLQVFILALLTHLPGGLHAQALYMRTNQVGYLPGEPKSAIVFSDARVKETFQLIREETGASVLKLKPSTCEAEDWGRFPYYYTLDFSSVKNSGIYHLTGTKSGVRSGPIHISKGMYAPYSEDLLAFMRQQRCGYNPFLDRVCHSRDGRSFYGPMPDSSYVDVSGGWHDAGDQLKYLITGSYATAHMLQAYLLYPEVFRDQVNRLGQSGPNGIPDVLDEARWGLEWIHKLHAAPDQLVHQVADDRDHVGWKMPDQDPSDYGWGKNSYRAAYFATGKPQGLYAYKSKATGLANLAGRSAAAMALGARIWKDLGDQAFAASCLRSAKSLYALGKEKEGFQQGNSYSQPYRYGEETWTDDMEWGAAELFMVTGDSAYLKDARSYARMAGTISWMPFDTAKHYQYYPFINMGHYALHEASMGALRDNLGPLRDSLAGYYRSGIEDCLARAGSNVYGIGIPFIWCSNNLLTALITQIILYEKMTGDLRYQSFLVKQRDWLFGRNPWGSSMFTGIPGGGEYPVDVHTSIWQLTRKEVPGGLVDGPVYETIFRSLKGLVLTEADEFAEFQNPHVVYHDDLGDYSTNEPTMDGTAGAILMMAHWASPAFLSKD